MYQGRRRKPNRLRNFDYSQSGWYFITICVRDRTSLFGEIKNGEMILNEFGEIVEKCWREIPNHFPDAALDEYVVMPNHTHGIIIVTNIVGNACVGNAYMRSLQPSPQFPQSSPDRTKMALSINQMQNQFYFQWQKSFHDHIIRNEKSYWQIKKYIRENPLNWLTDRNNPIMIKMSRPADKKFQN